MGRPKMDPDGSQHLTIRLSKAKRAQMEALKQKLNMGSLTELIVRSINALEELAKHANGKSHVTVTFADGTATTFVLE